MKTIPSIIVLFIFISSLYAGDTPCSATFIGNDLVNFTTINTDGSGDSGFRPPLCGDYQGQDYWLKFDAPDSGVVTIQTQAGSITNAAFAVYDNACDDSDNLSLGCYQDFDCGNILMPSFTLENLNSGQEYFVRIWVEGGGTGTFDIRISDPFNQDYELNGSAEDLDLNIQDFNCVRLTEAIDGQSGCAWYPIPIDFSQQFELELALYFGTNDADGADGIALVFQTFGPDRNCGGSGSGMGAQGISNSFIVEFDTWNNGAFFGDLPQDHIAIDINGNINNPIFGPEAVPNIEDGNLHFAKANWNPVSNLFTLEFDGVEYFSFNYDIISQSFNGATEIYWGATSSTGGSNNLQYLCFNSVTITNNVSYEIETMQQICNGDSLFVGGDFQKTEGIYTDVYSALNGCDSTVHTMLVVETIEAIGPEILELNCINDSTLVIDASNSIIDNPQNEITDISTLWTSLDGNILSGADGLTPLVNSSGIYTLSIFDNVNACSDELIVEVLPAIIPVADAGNLQTLDCNSLELNLDGSVTPPDENYSISWSTDDGNIISGELTTTPLIDQPGFYLLNVTDIENNCGASSTVEIDSNFDKPDFEITQSSILNCTNTEVQLSAELAIDSEEFLFEWSTIDGNILTDLSDSSIGVNSQGAYTLIVTDINNGCTSTAVVVVVESIEAPQIDADPILELSCQNNPVEIAIAVPNVSNVTYAWMTVDGNIVSGDGSNSILVDQEGTYEVTVVSNENGCPSMSSYVVDTNLEPPDALISMPLMLTCNVQSIFLDASQSSIGAEYEYLWTTTNGTIVSGEDTLFPEVGSEGNYLLTILNTNSGCTSEANVDVIENDNLPNEILVDINPPPCFNELGSVEITNVIGGEPEIVYSIDNGLTFLSEEIFEDLMPGDYQIIAKDANGCETSIDVSVPSVDDIDLLITDSVELFLGETYTVSADLINFTEGEIEEIIWSPTNDLSCTDCLNPTINPQQSSTYNLTIITENGCDVSASIFIEVTSLDDVFIPNIFIPGRDFGENGMFNIYANNNVVRQVNKFLIFDRWGNLIFQQSDVSLNDLTGWDGTYDSEYVAAGVYVYMIEVEFASGMLKVYAGDVTLLR
jgi:gliding motility-associated-like protein